MLNLVKSYPNVFDPVVVAENRKKRELRAKEKEAIMLQKTEKNKKVIKKNDLIFKK